MKNLLFLMLSLALLQGCQVRPAAYTSVAVPPPPDYSNPESWAALPGKIDPADRTPDTAFTDEQATASADVFFLHPTTFTYKSKGWNGATGDDKLNKKTDESTILHQASIFNGAGRVYAPRYRQAHLRSYFTDDKASASEAFDLAYEDLKAAFEYYLAHYNQGRPIIIASHSQGTQHALRLIKEFFDDKPLRQQLVAAYLLGWPIPENALKSIPPCESPDQTGCFCSWRSYKYGHSPRNFPLGDTISVVNPLLWTTSQEQAPKSLNMGTVLSKYEKPYPQIADAKIENGLLWVHKPKFPGSFLLTRKNYHVADFNFFWVNVRMNAQLRVVAFNAAHP
ncbi:MAG: DUF3089 domain-containing protein [Saprospiraceae bacterium]|nr:MAG: DUF3089 domain-containing protein [Saprospiraceae bacterium]